MQIEAKMFIREKLHYELPYYFVTQLAKIQQRNKIQYSVSRCEHNSRNRLQFLC